MIIKYHTLEEIDEVAKKIINFATELKLIKTKVWLFEGEMGVGKTTLIKAIARNLNVTDTVQSPTYSIVNEYLTKDNEVIYHFDFYRIKNEEEAMDLGYEEYFFDNKYCFVEWASKIKSLIPQNHLKIAIFIHEEGYRLIEITCHE